MNPKINIILVDDHAVVRAGFKMLLAAGHTINVIGEASRGEQAIQIYQELQPDIVVMDLSMPGIGGLETIRRIMQRDPEALILVFSVHHEQVYINRALSAGAKGYITKQSHPEVLIAAIKQIALGELYIEQGLINYDNAELFESTATKYVDYKGIIDSFSAREFDVFLLLAKGLTAHKIADELCMGYKTAANYGTQIRSKLDVSSIAELAHIAIMSGMMKD